MAPIKIRYFQCTNAGVAIIIWPQIRDAQNPAGSTLWDGRNDGSSYTLLIGQSVRVDLAATYKNTTTPFVLSSNTYWGTDMWETEQAFQLDPNSNVMACGTRWGAVDTGSFSFDGLKTVNLLGDEPVVFNHGAVPNPDVILQEAFHRVGGKTTIDGPGEWFKGVVEFPHGTDSGKVLAAAATVMARLAGYCVAYVTGEYQLVFRIGRGKRGEDQGDVPEQLKSDWDAAVGSAEIAHYKPQNRDIARDE